MHMFPFRHSGFGLLSCFVIFFRLGLNIQNAPYATGEILI